MNAAPDNENRFGLKVRQALDEAVAGLDQDTLERLASARRAAIQRKKAAAAPAFVYTPQLALAGGAAASGAPLAAGNQANDKRRRRFGRLALLWPVLALVVVLTGVARWEDQQRLADIADIDAAMLSDDLPLNAYLDHGFNAYLAQNQNR
ncbi:MAG: DUF3619 family protein [Janthinobacterium lividum]